MDSWIFGNLKKKWSTIVRRHVAAKQTTVETLQLQLSGYGAYASQVQVALDKSGIKEPLETWDDDLLKQYVSSFLAVRFPTVIVRSESSNNDRR